MNKLKTKTLVPWFGAARMVAEEIGKHLTGFKWVGIPCCGGMSEVPYIDAPSIACSDVHRHVINLAQEIRLRGDALAAALAAAPFHPDVLITSQDYCQTVEATDEYPESMFDWACHYFVTQWMGRSGKAGIDDEFNGGLSVRWNGNGGDSNTRYRSAVESIAAWQAIMRRCNFTCLDCFEFLDRCEDNPRHAVYCDPPWIGDGDRYKNRFTMEQHQQLADRLLLFKSARVVVRLGVCAGVERLYPRDRWRWIERTGRTQGNSDKAEVILVNAISERTLF
jgi:site-specific DNA-adenine methylase